MKKQKLPQFHFTEEADENCIGVIYCSRPLVLVASVMKSDSPQGFDIHYPGEVSKLQASILRKMKKWYLYTKVNKASNEPE
jgi:hypothetical protein